MAIGREIEDIARELIRHQHDHPPVRDLNREVDRKQTPADRIGADFARLIGSWIFVLAQLGLMVVWASLVLMALNRQSDRDRLRAQHDYELDVKSEEEVKALMNHLMHQDEILLQIVNRLDRGDNEMKRLLRRLEGPDNSTGSQAPHPEGAKRPT